MDSAEPSPSDISPAIKRLASGLRISVYVQAAALCSVFALGFFDTSGIIPSNPGWDAVYLFCRLLTWVGLITFVIATFWGVGKVARVARPIVIRMYVGGFFLLIFLLFLILFVPVLAQLNDALALLVLKNFQAIIRCFYILYFVFLFYSVIPQFFIARWLAKRAEDDAMQLVRFLRPPLLQQPSYLVVAIPAFMIVLLLVWVELINQVIMPPSPLVISEETTRVTGPLTEEGFIDFFKALEQRFYPLELATEDNGYRDFVRLFGVIGYDRKPDYREFYRLQLYEKLGLDSGVPPTLVLPDNPLKIFEDYYEAKGEEYTNEDRWDRPWTLEEFPMLADWVHEIDALLDAIAEALRKPVFFIPLLQDPSSAQTGVQFLIADVAVQTLDTFRFSRKIVQNFQARANYRIGLGDIDGAIDDKISMMRLGRHYARIGGFLLFSAGSTFERLALVIPVGANPEHPLTEQQIRRFLAERDALPPRTPITEAIEWERYTALDAIQFVMLGMGASRVLQPSGQDAPPMLVTRVFDWNVVFRQMNEAFDAMHEPLPRTKLASIVDGINVPDEMGALVLRLYYSLLIPGSRDTFITNAFTGIIAEGVSINRIEERMLETKCSENLHRLALAMLLYQLEHGKMPDENWTGQIEQYLGENPEQYFSCPVSPSVKGETRYALVQYGGTTGDTVAGSLDTILLVELNEPVALSEAVISVDDVLERKRWGCGQFFNVTAFRSSAVRHVEDEEELLRMLGRE
jgi:hypothetical protein